MLKPLSRARWGFATAAHLLNRAGFGGPPQEVEKLAAQSHEEAVAHFVDYEKIPDSTPDPDWAKPDPDRRKTLMEARNLPEQERRRKLQEIQRDQRQHMIELRG